MTVELVGQGISWLNDQIGARDKTLSVGSAPRMDHLFMYLSSSIL
jgi:hypothetical protein